MVLVFNIQTRKLPLELVEVIIINIQTKKKKCPYHHQPPYHPGNKIYFFN
jgi:hypothetical protein